MRLFKRRHGVDVHAAKQMIDRGEAVVLDVREPDEWAAGHIRGAVHVPLSALAQARDTLPPDRLVLAVCRSGNRSSRATSLLAEAGHRVENVDGGMKAWHAAGYAMDPPDGRVI